MRNSSNVPTAHMRSNWVGSTASSYTMRCGHSLVLPRSVPPEERRSQPRISCASAWSRRSSRRTCSASIAARMPLDARRALEERWLASR